MTACRVASSAAEFSRTPGRRTTSTGSRVRRAARPSMSPMTAIGSGAAMSRTKSHSPRSHTASISESHSVLDARRLVHHPLAGEAGVDELAAQQMCGVVHVDHVRHAGLVGPDAAGVGERLRIALGVDAPPDRLRRRPIRCGRGTPARWPASSGTPRGRHDRSRSCRRSDPRPAWYRPKCPSFLTFHIAVSADYSDRMSQSQHTIAGTVLTMPVRIRKADVHTAMFSVPPTPRRGSSTTADCGSASSGPAARW